MERFKDKSISYKLLQEPSRGGEKLGLPGTLRLFPERYNPDNVFIPNASIPTYLPASTSFLPSPLDPGPGIHPGLMKFGIVSFGKHAFVIKT